MKSVDYEPELPGYHIDFERNYFASQEVEEAEASKYQKALSDFETLHGKITTSARNLLHAFHCYDDIYVRFNRHYSYFYLRYAVNTQDEASAARSSELNSEFIQRTAFLHQELMGIDRQTLESFIRQEPGLEVYRFVIESDQRSKSHTLPLQKQEIISRLTPLIAEWQYELYSQILKHISFQSVLTDAGEFNVRTQRAVLAAHPDRKVRETGFKEFYAGYASQRDLFAYTLIKLVKARNLLAQMAQFEDAASEVYFDKYWTKAEVTALLERIGQYSELYKRYQRLRIQNVQRRSGYDTVHPWDISTSLTGERLPRFPFEQASQLIRAALAPLGESYTQELEQLLDPANGRLDIGPGEHRRPGGFSMGFPGVTTVFYMGGFQGYYEDMRILMHESTHAIHRQLMNKNQVLPDYATGPNYLFESFAIFHELLLADTLYQHETDRLLKCYYLEQFLDGKGMALFITAQDAALEQAIFAGVEQGSIVDADSIDALAQQINDRYTIWSGSTPELNIRWMTNRLFYEDPLYGINYVYGSLLALRYFEMFQLDPKRFAGRYIKFMQHGFDASPAVLLDRFLGIDLHDQSLLTSAVQFLAGKVQLLESEYLG